MSLQDPQLKKWHVELARKIIHTGVLGILLINYYSPLTAKALLLCVILSYTILEFARLKGKTIAFVHNIIMKVQRKDEGDRFITAPLSLFLGVLTCLFFGKYFSLFGIIAVTLGDSIASLVGSRVPSIKIPFSKRRSVAGSGACFSLLFLCFIIFAPWYIALILAFVATLLELLPTNYDNFFMGVGTTLAAYILYTFM